MTSLPRVTCLALALLLPGCGRSDPPTPSSTGKTEPPPVLPAPAKAPPAFYRDHYAKLEDCVHDWGYALKCVSVTPGSPPHQAGANFSGPVYAKSYREETQIQLRKEALDGGYAQSVASEASDRSIARSEVKP